MVVSEQKSLHKSLKRVFEVFVNSEGNIRPHFILTGESGSGKSHIVQSLAKETDVNFIEVNAAQLTKEGTSGNSLSKALAPLSNAQGRLTVVFVDEFDKLFISGNSNTSAAHETTVGVQNEFLRVLESSKTDVFGDYGRYNSVPVDNVLFVFAGAFNGEKDIDLDKLRDFGIKTEFLGRVGLTFTTEKLSLDSLLYIMENSPLLENYLKLFKSVEKSTVTLSLEKAIESNYEKNTLGVRMVNTLIHQYFITGGKQEGQKVTFQKTMDLD